MVNFKLWNKSFFILKESDANSLKRSNFGTDQFFIFLVWPTGVPKNGFTSTSASRGLSAGSFLLSITLGYPSPKVFIHMSVSVCLCLWICLVVSLRLGGHDHWITAMDGKVLMHMQANDIKTMPTLTSDMICKINVIYLFWTNVFHLCRHSSLGLFKQIPECFLVRDKSPLSKIVFLIINVKT